MVEIDGNQDGEGEGGAKYDACGFETASHAHLQYARSVCVCWNIWRTTRVRISKLDSPFRRGVLFHVVKLLNVSPEFRISQGKGQGYRFQGI